MVIYFLNNFLPEGYITIYFFNYNSHKNNLRRYYKLVDHTSFYLRKNKKLSISSPPKKRHIAYQNELSSTIY